MLRHSLLGNSFRTKRLKGSLVGGITKLSSPRRYIASGLSAFAAFVRSLITFSRLSVLGSVDEDIDICQMTSDWTPLRDER